MAPKTNARHNHTQTVNVPPLSSPILSVEPPPSSPIPSVTSSEENNTFLGDRPPDDSAPPSNSVTNNSRMSPDWDLPDNSYLAQMGPDGAYARLLEALLDWKTKPTQAAQVAAFMEYGTDIVPYPHYAEHLNYRKPSDSPLHIVLFGEVASENCGTSLGARGNHFVGGPTKVSHKCSVVRE